MHGSTFVVSEADNSPMYLIRTCIVLALCSPSKKAGPVDLGCDGDMRQALGRVDPLQQPPGVTQGCRELALDVFLDKHRQPISFGTPDRQCNEYGALFVEGDGRIPAFLVQHERMADDRRR